MNVVIIEDEIHAQDRMKSLLEEIDKDINVLAILPSIKESVQWLLNHSCDLIFLDIQLSDGMSFNIFDKVRITTPVIFTTAYDEYALKAFKYNGIDYLLKPVKLDEIKSAVNKFKNFTSRQELNINQLKEILSENKSGYKKRFLIQTGKKLKMIETSAIAYFHSFDGGVYLTTFSNQKYPVDMTIEKIEEQLDPDLFFRINRKIIINHNAIELMEAYSRGRVFLRLNPPTPKELEVIVSIDRSGSFKKWLDR